MLIAGSYFKYCIMLQSWEKLLKLLKIAFWGSCFDKNKASVNYAQNQVQFFPQK